jgi:hypothetical protein
VYATTNAGKPVAGKPGSGDTTPPSITGLDPSGETIGSSYTFSATVTDTGSGVRSVTFTIIYPNGTASQAFGASRTGADTYSLTISGFTDGDWDWRVTAKDNGAKGGNTATATAPFTVDTSGGGGGGGGGGGDGTVANSEWTGGGAVQKAAGRIYFEMPANSKLTRWNGYVCSGTVATDGVSGRSVIITAAHCVYDDVYKVFARNVMFIPNQAGTTSAGTDLNCSNDPMGCWKPTFGVVDREWTDKVFPANIPWHYAFYVVNDSGAHEGNGTNPVLDSAAGSLAVQTGTAPDTDVLTHALGYSYSDDPNFMYCAEGLGTESDYDDWWLSQCGLSGGSSGGPWIQPMNAATGSGPIVSVNSWGYTNQPGMGGPNLTGANGAGCVFAEAKSPNQTFSGANLTNRGIAVC